ncbi:MAG TPA: MFS transporter [Dehalococcoidales bacterium]|nr:MFS transporter [Dehalococcoidales bacterium]
MVKTILNPNYKWYILAMAMFTYGWITGAERNSMPVLFKEIATDLQLSTFSIGTIWGMDPLAGIFVGLLGGLLVDRFGIRKTLSVVCILAGLFSAVRGLSIDFLTMAGSMFLFGLMAAMLPSIVPKAAALWFPSRQVGFVNALINVALSVGSMFATMLSATVLSPWLGGWRNVLFVLAVPAVLVGILWALTGREPQKHESQHGEISQIPLRQSFSKVIKFRQVWILGLISLTLWGSLMGLMGYLPMYLRDIGHSAALSDTAVTVINAAGMVGSIPMVLLASRFRAYKQILLLSVIVHVISLVLIPLVDSVWLWPVLIISSFMRSATPALANVMLLETPGIGITYIGTAMGLMSSLGMIGACIAPPLGNSTAVFGLQWPFFVWAALGTLALPLFLFLKNYSQEGSTEFEERPA